MIASRLLKRVEANSEQIALAVIVARNRDPHLAHYRNLSDDEIRVRVRDLTTNLAIWLTTNDETPQAEHFERLGRLRYEQQMPLHEVIQKLMVLKGAIHGYVSEQNLSLTPLEIYEELEMVRAMAVFFDFVVFRVAKGYEQALKGNREWQPARSFLKSEPPVPAV